MFKKVPRNVDFAVSSHRTPEHCVLSRAASSRRTPIVMPPHANRHAAADQIIQPHQSWKAQPLLTVRYHFSALELKKSGCGTISVTKYPDSIKILLTHV